MAKKHDTFRLGVAVIIMFTLLLALIMFISGSQFNAPDTSPLRVRIASGGTIPQLSIGSLVMYLGQSVGQVTAIDFVEDVDPIDSTITDRSFLEVSADVRTDLGLRKDCRVTASGPPLGGKGTLTILERGIDSATYSQDKPIYANVRGFDAALDMIAKEFNPNVPDSLLGSIKVQLNVNDKKSLVAKIHTSLDDLNDMTQSLTAELSEKVDGHILYKVHASLDKLYSSLSQVDTVVKENSQPINQSVLSMQSAMTTFDKDIATVLSKELELKSKSDQSMLTTIKEAFAKLNDSMSEIKTLSKEAKDVIVLNKDRIGEIVENAAEASAHLKQGVKDIKTHPWKVLFKPSDAERRELHIFNTAREFADAAAGLDDATSRLQSLLKAYDGNIATDDPNLQKINDALIAASEKFTQAEQALWDAMKIK